MHDYMIKNKVRRRVNEILICGYLMAVFVIKYFVGDHLFDITFKFFNTLKIPANYDVSIYIGDLLSIILPGVGIGVVYWIYDKWAWRWWWVKKWHKVPDLNGHWEALIDSPLKGSRKPVIEMTIQQTWNKISIYGKSQHGTETISDSAMVMEREGGTYMGYSYRIHHRKEPSYPGFNMLLYKEDKLHGDYYSNKDVRDDFREILGNMCEEEALKLEEKLKGCGSKGYILFQRV